jgi:hypothetical protein
MGGYLSRIVERSYASAGVKGPEQGAGVPSGREGIGKSPDEAMGTGPMGGIDGQSAEGINRLGGLPTGDVAEPPGNRLPGMRTRRTGLPAEQTGMAGEIYRVSRTGEANNPIGVPGREMPLPMADTGRLGRNVATDQPYGWNTGRDGVMAGETSAKSEQSGSRMASIDAPGQTIRTKEAPDKSQAASSQALAGMAAARGETGRDRMPPPTMKAPALVIGKITVEVIQPAAAVAATAARNRRPRPSGPAGPSRRSPGSSASRLGFGLGQI